MSMKPRTRKQRFFQLFGFLLLGSAIILGYYQYQWIRTATSVEMNRIINEMHNSSVIALEKAFDEIRALISFSYITPADFFSRNWEGVGESISYWKSQSTYPDLLDSIYIIPVGGGDPYLAYEEGGSRFVTTDTPDDFALFERDLAQEHPLDAFRKNYPVLLMKGYFIFPLSTEETPAISAFLAIKIDPDLFYKVILPEYLTEYVGHYMLKVTAPGTVFYSSVDLARSSREADHEVKIFHNLFRTDRGRPFGERPPEDRPEGAMVDPITRYWFLRTDGFPGIEEEQFSHSPTLEIFFPDRSLETAMRRRMVSSLLLSAGTLLVLIAAYFALYALLRRTNALRSREHDFVTSMSHELRTPLSVISATSDNLVRGIVDNPDRIKKYGNLIQTQSQRLGKMVESILFYSGLESLDAGAMHDEEINLDTFFGEILHTLAPAAEEAGVRVVFARDTGIDSARSDSNAVRLIAENLIVNAFRHGVGSQSDPEVRVEIRTRPPRFLYLTVEDDGPGIPADEMKRVFEPFARGERSKVEQVPGSGLGLHIVRRVSTRLGGQVTVESPYPDMAGGSRRGARFTVKIPVELEE